MIPTPAPPQRNADIPDRPLPVIIEIPLGCGPGTMGRAAYHSCNRLLSQYAALLRSASTTPSGIVENEPSASLSAAMTISSLRTKLSAQNISVACERILDLIRTLRLSVLTMGTEHTEEEHSVVVQEMMAKIEQDVDASLELAGVIIQLQGRLK